MVAYVVALVAGGVTVWFFPDGEWNPLHVAAVADIVATAVVFGFSRRFDNSSFYDPYWSVAPVPLLVLFAEWGDPEPLRATVMLSLFFVWAVRLTYNWARGWEGFSHEDWRYVDLRRTQGRRYWWVSFFGLHLMPTLMVFAGLCGPAVALSERGAPFGALDVLAALVMAAAIAIEAAADEQLRNFRRVRRPGQILQTGLWRYSRHPNYFGELSLWWGGWLFGMAAVPGAWWTLVGPVSMTILFVFISVPLMERRSAHKPGYAEYAARTSSLCLWFPRRTPPPGL